MEKNGDTPATKSDLSTGLKALEQRIEGKIDASEQRMLDTVTGLIRDSETRLLQAFYSFAEANNKRLNQVDGNVAIFLNRLGTVESRILEIEKRLNIPPSA